MATKCDGHNRRRGTPCKFWAVPGNTKCRYHGGLSLKGIACPAYKHGRYSRYSVSRSLFKRWEELLADPDPHSLLDEIIIVRGRIENLLVGLESMDVSAAWLDANREYMEYKIGLRSKDTQRMSDALQRLGLILESGGKQESRWEALENNLEQLRRLVETDRKAQDMSEKYLTVEQGMMIVSMAVAAVKEEVSDPKVLSRIITRINQDMRPTG